MKIHKAIETIRNMKPSQYTDDMLGNLQNIIQHRIGNLIFT